MKQYFISYLKKNALSYTNGLCFMCSIKWWESFYPFANTSVHISDSSGDTHGSSAVTQPSTDVFTTINYRAISLFTNSRVLKLWC